MTRIVRYAHAGQNRVGVLDGEHYIDINRAYAAVLNAAGVANAQERADALLPADILKYFQGGASTASALAEAVIFAGTTDLDAALAAGLKVRIAETKTLIPIPDPPKIVCVARNFGKHAAEAGLPVSEIPILFARFAATQVADGDPVIVPTVSDQVDWEGELAVVIGKGGRHISKEAAFDHVGGYTVFNDVSVRDYQFRVAQYTGGKNFHASGPVGPHIVLTDEQIDPHNLQITTTVNGVVKQDGNTKEFIFDIPTIIEHISEFIELEAGDIIPMGTPAGVGFKREPAEFLRDGDVVEVTVEQIGVLRNPVRNEEK